MGKKPCSEKEEDLSSNPHVKDTSLSNTRTHMHAHIHFKNNVYTCMCVCLFNIVVLLRAETD